MAIELSIPNDLSSRTAQEKADFYSTQRMAGFSDPAIRNAVSSTIGPQADDDWNYLLQLSGYANVPPDQQRGSLPYGNSLIAALRNNTQQLPAGSMSSYTMLPNQAPAPPVAAPPPSRQPNYLNIVRPFPATGTAPTTGKRDLTTMLPFNWDTYDANRKIDWFNQTGATQQELQNAGVTQAEIDWMLNNGYGSQPAASPPPPPPPAVNQPSTVAGLNLPSNWYTDYDANEKINWFNQNKVYANALRNANAGVTEADIEWMTRNGYIPYEYTYSDL